MKDLQHNSQLPQPLLSVAQACEILGLHKSALYEIMSRGDLPFVNVSDRKRMIVPVDLQEFISMRRTGGWNREGIANAS